MSRDHHPPLRDVTADTENSLLYCCMRVFRAWPREDVLLLLRVRTCLRSCGLNGHSRYNIVLNTAHLEDRQGDGRIRLRWILRT
jgi:hypothetical protein